MEINGLPQSTTAITKNNLGRNNESTSSELSFGNFLKNAVEEVNELHAEANQAAEKIASGKEVDIHNTMIALEKADVSFQLMLQIRNKTLEAYQEIMRMQV